MSGSLSYGGTKNRPKPGNSAGLFSPTDRLARGSRSAKVCGRWHKVELPPGPSGLVFN